MEEMSMDVRELLLELFGRIGEEVRGAVAGLDREQLVTPPEPGANTVAWLVWHLARVQDSHVAELVDEDQLWVSAGWAARCAMEPDPDDTGYGHTPEQMAAVRPDGADVLLEYYDAVAARTNAFVERLAADDLDRIVDERWNPPVTLGVRLVSIADDDIQHAGQAAYARGLLLRR
jgi:uncharacterized damage-inducible protein DinB